MDCRSCSDQLLSILKLGEMPLANRLLKKAEIGDRELKFNLELMLCQKCSLVQLRDTVDAKILFNEYLYFSSNSFGMVESCRLLAEKIQQQLRDDAVIIEIASNDGYLLQHYLSKKYKLLGLEPAKNIAEYAASKGIPTRAVYFSSKIAEELVQENFSADVIHANNVMAHVPEINDFALGIKTLLKPNGQAIIEVPYLLNLIHECEFDTIYHEHIFYFSMTALSILFARHDLLIADVEEISIHGGSLRLYIKHSAAALMSEKVKHLLHKEKELNISHPQFYQGFTANIYQLKEKLWDMIKKIKNKGFKIAAYGASAKGSTLLNFFGMGQDIIEFIVDKSPAKQGYFMSGVHIPIYEPHLLLEKNISHTLLLTWNFKNEILTQQAEYRKSGGKFIIPIPTPEII